MYLRHTTCRKDGKIHTYWWLVRSVRIGRWVAQQTVAQLGELDAQGRACAKALAQSLVGGLTQAELFTAETAVDAVVPVCLDQVRLGWKACLGPDGAETFLLVRSIEQREKERAICEIYC